MNLVCMAASSELTFSRCARATTELCAIGLFWASSTRVVGLAKESLIKCKDVTLAVKMRYYISTAASHLSKFCSALDIINSTTSCY